MSSTLLRLLGLAGTAQAACSNLVIDNFSRSAVGGNNKLKSWTSDDSSMANIALKNGVLSFTPKTDTSSYYYETLGCVKAASKGYKALSMTINGPKDASVMLEIQTKASCSDTNYQSQWVQITGLTGSAQNVSIALSSFTTANLDAVSGFVWSTYSVFDKYQFSNLQFTCDVGSNPAPPTAPASSSVISTSSIVILSSTTTSSFATSVRSSGSTDNVDAKTSSSPRTSTLSSRTSTSASTPISPTSMPTSSASKSFSRSIPLTSSSASLSSSTSSSPSSPSAVSSSATSTSATPVSTVSRSSSSNSVISGTVTAPSSPSSSTCSNLLIDDWASQSRLTFLFYNAMLLPSSDDGTMKAITVANNRVTLQPSGQDSYFYSKTGCINAKAKGYGGISLRIKAKAGTTFQIQMASSATCGEDSAFGYATTKDLGWTFNGKEQLYNIPFPKFSGFDTSKISSILFSSLTSDVTFGPMAFSCGNAASEYTLDPQAAATASVVTVPAPSGTNAAKVVDNFSKKDSNSLGFWHGGDVDTALTWGTNKLTIKAPDSDFSFYTQLSATCADMTGYDGAYLHIAFTGSNKFTIALQQHNSQCNDAIAPFPETWDSLEAARYTTGNDIFIPMTHFNIVRSRVVGIAFKGWYTNEATTFTKVQIVSAVPKNVYIPSKLPSGSLMFGCKRNDSIAFAIDDGAPEFAQEVMEVIKSENIKVTFFTVGAPLRDPSTNLSSIYKDMMAQGHQIALHSYTHPHMEGLPNNDAIAWEYDQDIQTVKETFGLSSKYFRPPFGTEGARMRQQLVKSTGNDNPYIVNWNIDVEDWLWAQSDTPQKQLESFKRDLDKGGSLVVMHYLYPSTVKYLRQFIQMAKATNKTLMRVDQCMMDPDAPAL